MTFASVKVLVERGFPTDTELLTLVRCGVQVPVRDICALLLLIVAIIFSFELRKDRVRKLVDVNRAID